jgi:hypothetical protein
MKRNQQPGIQRGMSLENKTLDELIELRLKLIRNINANPLHAGLNRVELEDVQGWIELRIRERDRANLVPQFDKSDE